MIPRLEPVGFTVTVATYGLQPVLLSWPPTSTRRLPPHNCCSLYSIYTYCICVQTHIVNMTVLSHWDFWFHVTIALYCSVDIVSADGRCDILEAVELAADCLVGMARISRTPSNVPLWTVTLSTLSQFMVQLHDWVASQENTHDGRKKVFACNKVTKCFPSGSSQSLSATWWMAEWCLRDGHSVCGCLK